MQVIASRRRKVFLAILTLLLIALVAFTAFEMQPPGDELFARESVLTPVADASISASRPDRNYGQEVALEVDGDPHKISYVTFEVPPLTHGIVSATLRMFAVDDSASGGFVTTTDTGWSEGSLVYDNRPTAFGPILSSQGEVTSGTWYEWDVTSATIVDGLISFAISTRDTDGADYSSRETGTAPQLVLRTESTAPPPSTPTPRQSGESTANEFRFTPTEDTWVSDSGPIRNAGQAGKLEVDANPHKLAYLRFEVEGLTSPVTSAHVRLFVLDRSASGGSIATIGDEEWSSESMTYDSRPTSVGALLDHRDRVDAGNWYEFDVTPAVAGNGTLSFVIATDNNDGVDFASLESNTPPELIVRVSTGTSGQSTPQPETSTGAVPAPTATSAVGPDSILGEESVTIMAAGDIACEPTNSDFRLGIGTDSACRANSTADIVIQHNPDAVLVPGDLQYAEGELSNFMSSYNPSWGQFKDKTYPVPGNHEYRTSDAAGYFDYFGEQAGEEGKGYYSVQMGNWQVIALNSNCAYIAGCEPGSPQYEWLRQTLETGTGSCEIALLHHPRWSSGRHGNNDAVGPLYELLYEYGVEVAIAGHDHDYERFAPQDPSGRRDDTRGIRDFIVGTGGRNLYRFGSVAPNSEVRENKTFGVLKMELNDGSYEWEFVPEAGKTFSDVGSGSCH